MENNFLEFTKEHYPEILEEFLRYERKEILPEIGTEVITLRSGFGGPRGEIRYVVEFDDKRFIGLATMPKGNAKYLCQIETWWKDLKIASESYKKYL